MVERLIHVEIIYVSPDRHVMKALKLPSGSSVQQAVTLSGILEDCPEIDLKSNRVGIFSQLCALEQEVQHGDRVEIYRPLIQDPKEARRQRANKVSPRRK